MATEIQEIAAFEFAKRMASFVLPNDPEQIRDQFDMEQEAELFFEMIAEARKIVSGDCD